MSPDLSATGSARGWLRRPLYMYGTVMLVNASRNPRSSE